MENWAGKLAAQKQEDAIKEEKQKKKEEVKKSDGPQLWNLNPDKKIDRKLFLDLNKYTEEAPLRVGTKNHADKSWKPKI